MKTLKLILVGVSAAFSAIPLFASTIEYQAATMSDLKLCEQSGREYFINGDMKSVNVISQEVNARRATHKFSINSRACGIYGLASAVNVPESKSDQIKLALKGIRRYRVMLEVERITETHADRAQRQ